MKRFELSTLSLARRCSTTELHPHGNQRLQASSSLTSGAWTIGVPLVKPFPRGWLQARMPVAPPGQEGPPPGRMALLRSSPIPCLFSVVGLEPESAAVHAPAALRAADHHVGEKVLDDIWIDLLPLLPGGVNGGAKPFILQLLLQLVARQPQARFTAVCRQTAAADLRQLIEAPNLRLHLQPGPAEERITVPKRWLGSRRLARLAQRLGPGSDGPSPQTQLLFCPFGAPLLHRPGLATVCTFYDLQFEAFPDFFPARILRERRHHFQQMVARATRIGAISEFSRRSAIARGVPEPSIRTIPIQIAPGSRGDARTTPEGLLPSRLGLEPGRYLLYPANLWKHKNHERLFTAFAMARRQGLDADLQLVCTGDAVDRHASLTQHARSLGLAHGVHLPGFVSEADLEALYTHALAVVFPSLYEGFGMPVIEAMARGVPVACSAGTALEETAGSAALLFPPEQPALIAAAMLRLSRDGLLRAELIAKGHLRARRYRNPAQMADQYWDLFQEAFASHEAARTGR
jgi:glycosyltransferase involved in cell wall biosynthesis